MRELAQLQKEKNDWRCNSWLETATGRSTILAAVPGMLLYLVSASFVYMHMAIHRPQEEKLQQSPVGNGVLAHSSAGLAQQLHAAEQQAQQPTLHVTDLPAAEEETAQDLAGSAVTHHQQAESATEGLAHQLHAAEQQAEEAQMQLHHQDMRVANAEAAQRSAEAERDTLMQEAARLQERMDQLSQVCNVCNSVCAMCSTESVEVIR